MIQHADSDAWLLLTLIYAGEPIGYQKMREIGDYINHAIFTSDELRGGLKRLRSSGHILRSGKKYAATGHTLKWYKSTVKGKARTAVLMDLERVENLLGVKRISN